MSSDISCLQHSGKTKTKTKEAALWFSRLPIVCVWAMCGSNAAWRVSNITAHAAVFAQRLDETTFVIRLEENETPTAAVRLWVEGSRWALVISEIPLFPSHCCAPECPTPALYAEKEHFSGSLAHAGMRAVVILTCRQQCANKAGVIAPAEVSSYC